MVGGFNLIILIIFLFLILLLCYVFHIRLDFKSFFRKGFIIKRGLYGTYCFNAPQGKGKTMALAYYCFRANKKSKIFFNIYFNNLDDFEFFEDFNYIYSIIDRLDSGDIKRDKQIVIIWDELFSLLGRSSKTNKQLISLLSQMRKRKIIFLTTCQDWSSIPIDFRRLCRFCIDTKSINIPIGVFINIYKDAERMKWDEKEMDFVAPIVWTKIYKSNKIVANSYDTNQIIKATNTF